MSSALSKSLAFIKIAPVSRPFAIFTINFDTWSLNLRSQELLVRPDSLDRCIFPNEPFHMWQITLTSNFRPPSSPDTTTATGEPERPLSQDRDLVNTVVYGRDEPTEVCRGS